MICLVVFSLQLAPFCLVPHYECAGGYTVFLLPQGTFGRSCPPDGLGCRRDIDEISSRHVRLEEWYRGYLTLQSVHCRTSSTAPLFSRTFSISNLNLDQISIVFLLGDMQARLIPRMTSNLAHQSSLHASCSLPSTKLRSANLPCCFVASLSSYRYPRQILTSCTFYCRVTTRHGAPRRCNNVYMSESGVLRRLHYA